jgi:NAD(P)-dependent dehydrogenase (short-subunit alcohol dehydrogenase family)
MFDLTGRTALVTGASRGLGKSIALCLAKAGADVAVNYFGAEAKALSVAGEIRSLGKKAIALQGDVGKESDVHSLFANIEKEFGRLDILINNAGINSDFDITTLQVEEWDRILRSNLTGNFLCAKYAVALMKERKFGRIIQISSVVGEQGALYGHVHYAATKGGQLGFTKTLARSVAPYGITVNAIAPGVHMTEQVEGILGNTGASRLESVKKNIPLGILGGAEGIGWAAVFLSSEEAGYITGATLDVNGGLYMR